MPGWMVRKMVTVEEERLSQSQEVPQASQPSQQSQPETEKAQAGAGWLVSQMEETYNKESGISQSQDEATTIGRRKSFVFGKLSPEAGPAESSLSPPLQTEESESVQSTGTLLSPAAGPVTCQSSGRHSVETTK